MHKVYIDVVNSNAFQENQRCTQNCRISSDTLKRLGTALHENKYWCTSIHNKEGGVALSVILIDCSALPYIQCRSKVMTVYLARAFESRTCTHASKCYYII